MEFVNPEGLRLDGRRPHEACAKQQLSISFLSMSMTMPQSL